MGMHNACLMLALIWRRKCDREGDKQKALKERKNENEGDGELYWELHQFRK